MALTRTKFILPEDRIPRAWYNINADLPVPLSPPLHPGTLQPVGPDDLLPLFPMALIVQEMSMEREVESPSRCARPTPCTDPRRSSAPIAWRRRWAPRRTSTTSTRASARPAATSPTPPSRRPSTTRRRASPA